MIKYLIEQGGADINKGNSYGETPLLFACKNKNKKLMKYLLEHDVNVNKELKNGKTPLCFTYDYRNGNVTIAKYLMDHGAS